MAIVKRGKFRERRTCDAEEDQSGDSNVRRRPRVPEEGPGADQREVPEEARRRPHRGRLRGGGGRGGDLDQSPRGQVRQDDAERRRGLRGVQLLRVGLAGLRAGSGAVLPQAAGALRRPEPGLPGDGRDAGQRRLPGPDRRPVPQDLRRAGQQGDLRPAEGRDPGHLRLQPPEGPDLRPRRRALAVHRHGRGRPGAVDGEVRGGRGPRRPDGARAPSRAGAGQPGAR